MEILNLPVDTIEGIGPAYAALLRQEQIITVHDLLLYAPISIADRTGIPASRIEKWRSAALLLELPAFDHQLAEALVAGGIATLDALLSKDLESLTSIFEAARTSGLIADVPDSSALFAMVREAASLHYGATLQGVIRNDAGVPLEGVAVLSGRYKTRSNARGIWRISGVHHHGALSVFISKDGYVVEHLPNFPAQHDDFTTELVETILHAGENVPIVLDEYLGDALPPLQCYDTDIRIESTPLREGDMLRVHSIYANNDVKMVSLFNAMENNELVIRCYRVSNLQFAETPAIDSIWQPLGDGLRQIPIRPQGIPLLKRLRRTSFSGSTRADSVEAFFNGLTSFSIAINN